MKTFFYAAALALSVGMLLGAAEPNLLPLPKTEPWRKNAGTGTEKVFKTVLNDDSIQFGNKTV